MVVGIISIVPGVLLAVFRKPFARDAIRQQNDLFGFRFGECVLRRTEYIAVLLGISSIGFGVYVLLFVLGYIG